MPQGRADKTRLGFGSDRDAPCPGSELEAAAAATIVVATATPTAVILNFGHNRIVGAGDVSGLGDVLCAVLAGCGAMVVSGVMTGGVVRARRLGGFGGV